MAASKFTDETRFALLELRADGATLEQSCQQVGVSDKTFKSWLTKGRRPDAEEKHPEYFDFACAWDAATDAAESAAAEPMTPEEVMQHLERMVRAGNVRAIELWFREQRAASGDDASALTGIDALDAEDELAARREGKGKRAS
jgi:hypothetical protein